MMYSTTTSSAQNVLAATFIDRDNAHAAARRLHEEGFHGAWIGRTTDERDTTYANDIDASAVSGTAAAMDNAPATRVESDNWFQRLFGEGDESLHDALVKHGVSEADAITARAIEPGGAILIIDGANHPEYAVQIISECGGRTITSGYGAAGYGTPGDYLQPAGSPSASRANDASAINPDPSSKNINSFGAATGHDADNGHADRFAAADGYQGYGRFRSGAEIDDEHRLQLREERLRIDKQRDIRGEAIVGTEVITEQQSVDVPFVREELYVRRQPVDGRTAVDTSAPIGSGETIRIPLAEERISVTKTPVLIEEVVVGKRDVNDVQHISETTRREELRVNDIGDGPVKSEAARVTS